jgi:hypothetical protein
MRLLKTVFVLFMLVVTQQTFAINNQGSDPNAAFSEMLLEIVTIQKKFFIKHKGIKGKIHSINKKIAAEKSVEKKLNLLVEKDVLNDSLSFLSDENENEIIKIKYLKGLNIIRLLYDKSLSLDHHFSSVRTFSEINKMANPNQYPEYANLKELISAKKDKRIGIDLGNILSANTLVSIINAFNNLMISNISKEEKEKELANVECILDFTLRMQNDLNTIFFETSYLQNSNTKIKEEIEILFKEYTKPIGYHNTLDNCRTNDDWDTLNQKMNAYLQRQKDVDDEELQEMEINMEFPVDRLIQFIAQYNSFIDQGGKFYQKFDIILNSYQNLKQCETKLPLEFNKLKQDIEIAIEKFNKAYKPVEINGSKMKELLYGVNEF